MINKLHLQNFRGIVKNTLDLGKITAITGANNSGKSSIMYGLLALKNVVLNSNQNLDSFLNFGFLNLGGFTENVFKKEDKSNILFGIDSFFNKTEVQYRSSLGRKKSDLSINILDPYNISLSLEVNFPYPANKTYSKRLESEYGIIDITWNGISPTIKLEQNVNISDDIGKNYIDKLNETLNVPVEELRAIDFIPLKRGFTRPIYSSVPMPPQLLSEEELATLLATDRNLEGLVSYYLEQIVNRNFSIRPTALGAANFYLQSSDRSTGLVFDLVNEGFGTNQLVTILTKSLRKDFKTICIEEPEIHLHPELMDKLVDVLINITQNENKQFIISTHSEHIILSLLNKVVKSKISPDDIKIYYLSKDKEKTKVEEQKVNEKGQIEGGLKSFYETELKQVKSFFDLAEE